MFQVFNARLYLARWRELQFADMPMLVTLPFPVAIVCPRCAMGYFAELTELPSDVNVSAAERQVTTRLNGECPDHAHRFALG